MNPFRWIALGLRNLLVSRRQAPQDIRLRVMNRSPNTVLATHMEVADNAAKRNKGLLGRKCLDRGEGMWIRPCEAVHTFWMRFPIDLVYLDRKNRIRKLSSEVPPWRLSACLFAHSVLELVPGTIRNTQTQPGDLLEFSPASLTSDSPQSPSAHAWNETTITMP